MKKIKTKFFEFLQSPWSKLLSFIFCAGLAFILIIYPDRVSVGILFLIGLLFLVDAFVQLIEFRISFSCEIDSSSEPEQAIVAQDQELIKALYEHIRTRAVELECAKEECPWEPFHLWVNIKEIHALLSIYHNGDLKSFLAKTGDCYDHGFGCDADDHDLPAFPDK